MYKFVKRYFRYTFLIYLNGSILFNDLFMKDAYHGLTDTK